jgi:hypothetical protein
MIQKSSSPPADKFSELCSFTSGGNPVGPSLAGFGRAVFLDFFVIQLPNKPFGLIWYQGDIYWSDQSFNCKSEGTIARSPATGIKEI